MAERLFSSGGAFDMHYCARSTDRMAFVERINAAGFRDRARFHVDDGAPEQRFDLAAVLAAAPEGTHLYVCGPRGFMDAVLNAARERGWAEARLHYEFFGGAVAASGADRAFQVRIASSGQVIDVPAECTVIAALAANGVDVLTSCEQGVCGTCLTRVLQGGRSPRCVSDRRRKSRRRPVHALLLASANRPAGTRSVDGHARPEAAHHHNGDDQWRNLPGHQSILLNSRSTDGGSPHCHPN